MLVSLIVARPFPYAADGLNTKTVMRMALSSCRSLLCG